MSGADLQESVIAKGLRIPIIFVTAVCNDVMRARLLKRGALGVLGKPFDESLLIECLHEAIRHL